MCLVARSYSMHGTTQNNGNEIGRFRCVMCFCNTLVTFCICIITHISQKINTYFSKITYFVYYNQTKRWKGEENTYSKSIFSKVNILKDLQKKGEYLHERRNSNENN